MLPNENSKVLIWNNESKVKMSEAEGKLVVMNGNS